MHCDAGCFVLVQLDGKAPLDLLERIPSQFPLPWILLLHLINQRHLHVNMLLRPLDTEVDMIRQCQDNIGVKFVIQFIFCDINQFYRKMQHLFRQLIKQRQIFLVNIVKHTVDPGWIGYLVRCFWKTNALPVCNQFFSFIVDTDCKVVVQFFYRTHYRTTSKEKLLKA